MTKDERIVIPKLAMASLMSRKGNLDGSVLSEMYREIYYEKQMSTQDW